MAVFFTLLLAMLVSDDLETSPCPGEPAKGTWVYPPRPLGVEQRLEGPGQTSGQSWCRLREAG